MWALGDTQTEALAMSILERTAWAMCESGAEAAHAARPLSREHSRGQRPTVTTGDQADSLAVQPEAQCWDAPRNPVSLSVGYLEAL